MPDDEPKEYLITQMIADFVAQVGEPPIDGMLYRSVQSAGEHQNVVFFNHASCVAEWDVPINAEVDARTFEMDEDGGSIDYSVIEWVPPKEEVQPVESNWPFGLDQFVPFDTDAETSRYDGRAETLQLDPKSLQVRHVTGVTIATDTYDVDRRRYEKRDFNKIAKLANLDVIDPDVAF